MRGYIRAQAGQRGCQLLDPVTSAAMAAMILAATDHHMRCLVKPQKLGEAEVKAGRDLGGNRESRAGGTAFDLREHRRAYPAALGKIPERVTGGLTQGFDPG